MNCENLGIKRKSLTKIICFALLIAVIFSIIFISNKNGVPVSAETIKEQENKLNALKKQQTTNQEKQKDVQRTIADIKARTNNQLELKECYDNEIILIQEEIQLCESIVECLEIKINEQKAEIEEAQKNYDESYELCKAIITYSFEEDYTTDYISVLLDSKSLEDFLRHVDIINELMEYNKTTLEKFREDTKNLTNLKVINEDAYISQLEYIERIEEEKEALNRKIEAAGEALKELAREQQSAEAAAAKIKRDEESMQNLIVQRSNALAAQIKAEEAAAAERAAAAKSQSTTKSSAGYVGGTTGWPVTPKYPKNPITDGYGERKNPFTGRSEFHLGIDIPAAYGSSVWAFNSGTVILSEWYSSYGYCIVVDHGGGVTTLYAHNSVLVAKYGDKVNKGDVIAKVGSTGASTGPHCHFEYAVNGARQDPIKYLPK